MYVWRPQQPVSKPTAEEAVAEAEQLSVNKLLSRPNIEITEEGNTVVITLPTFTITIAKK